MNFNADIDKLKTKEIHFHNYKKNTNNQSVYDKGFCHYCIIY